MMDTQIIFAEISNESNAITHDLLRFVSNERQERIKKFRFDIDRKLSLYSELLIRFQASKVLKISNKEIVFKTGKNGKPFLLNHPDFQFNISHTRNAIVVAFSHSEIGVDVESIKSANFAIANRFFTSSEKKHIISHDNTDYAFYEVWTKKDAYIKYLGSGLSIPLKSFDVLDCNMRSFHIFNMGKYVISTFCRELAHIEPTIVNMSEAEILSNFIKWIHRNTN